MTDWIVGILAAVAALAAWILRGFFAGRTEVRLERERDTARVDAERRHSQAEARRVESEIRSNQQKTEDAIHAEPHDGVSARLDDLFRR